MRAIFNRHLTSSIASKVDQRVQNRSMNAQFRSGMPFPRYLERRSKKYIYTVDSTSYLEMMYSQSLAGLRMYPKHTSVWTVWGHAPHESIRCSEIACLYKGHFWAKKCLMSSVILGKQDVYTLQFHERPCNFPGCDDHFLDI